MPVRRQTVGRLVQDVVGTHIFDGRTGLPGFGDPMPPEEYPKIEDACDELYLRIADAIDWTRLLLEAQGRCYTLDHGHSDRAVCGESMHHAVVSLEWATASDKHWRENPVPAKPRRTDWPRAVATALRWRSERLYAGWKQGDDE